MGNLRSLCKKTEELAALTCFQRKYRDHVIHGDNDDWDLSRTQHFPLIVFRPISTNRTLAEIRKKKGRGAGDVFVHKKELTYLT